MKAEGLILESSHITEMQDRLYQALHCDQSELSKLIDRPFQLCPKNGRHNVQEILVF